MEFNLSLGFHAPPWLVTLILASLFAVGRSIARWYVAKGRATPRLAQLKDISLLSSASEKVKEINASGIVRSS